jgi:hypothetical protein
MATGHRVISKCARKAPLVLPKEPVRRDPREYVDRWGNVFAVVWNGQLSDPSIDQLGRTIEASS